MDAAATHDHFEDMVAVSPIDPSFVVSASMYRDNGSVFDTSIFVSRDAGHSWTRSFLPYGDRAPLTHPMHLVNSVVDPAITVASDGSVLFAGVGFTDVGASSTQLPTQDLLFVARSTDGGRSFPIENVQVLQQSFVPYQEYSDMPRFASGPGGLVLLGWGSADLPAPSALPRFAQTLDVNKAASLEGRFSVSRDAGASWSAPRVAFRDGETLYYPVHPAILADGSWAFMPSDYQNTAGGRVYFTRSTDEGASWSWQDTGLVGLLQGDLAASRADGKLYYSFLLPTGDLSWATPAVAVADGPDGPWRTIALTSEPVRRLAIEDTIAVDSGGTAHVVFLVARAGDTDAQIRIASIAPDGTLTETTMDTAHVDHLATHYFGLDATPSGAIATWDAGASPFALHAGAVS